MDEAKISQGTDGLYLENFYTPLEEAKNELWKRWNDKALRREVDKFLKGAIPEFLRETPKAVLLVYIATPDLYSARFLELAEEINLEPICLEYPDDKFYAGNLDKYYLGKLLFFNGKGKKGGIKVTDTKIIDINKSQGKRLSEIQTTGGENLYNFHRRLIISTYNNHKILVINWSKWIKLYIPYYYYYYYYGLFICHGIYFENFFVNSNEKEIIEDIILPSFNKVYNHFGLKPLIVPIIPFPEEGDIYWWCYHESIKPVVESLTQAEGHRFGTETNLLLD